jgi:hypothetical protein
MENTLNPNSKTVKLAASLFFAVCIPVSFWSEMYVPAKVFVAQDPVATANNLLANEFIFRTSVLGHLTGFLFFVMMMFLFYRVLSQVDKHLSLLMLVAVLAHVPFVLVLEVFNIGALMILKSEPRSGFEVAHQQEAAYFLLRVDRIGAGFSKFFLGLSFIPFGMLVFRSGFAPKFLGVLLIISGVGYIADTFSYILLDRSIYLMVRPFERYTFIGFMVTLIWFLVKGVRVNKTVI